MAQSHDHSVDAQIEALVEIFIEGITPREALALLDEGPSALHSACFAWAFKTADEIAGIDELDVTCAISLMERAPVVARLREAALEGFTGRFGAPLPPPMPARPGGLEADVQTELHESERRRMSTRARLLCETVVYGMCISWQTIYYVTRNRDRSQFVLWVKWEDGSSWGPTITTQQAWLHAKKGLSEHDAALILLEDYWKASEREWSAGRPNEVTAYGSTITQDELEAVADRVWVDHGTSS